MEELEAPWGLHEVGRLIVRVVPPGGEPTAGAPRGPVSWATLELFDPTHPTAPFGRFLARHSAAELLALAPERGLGPLGRAALAGIATQGEAERIRALASAALTADAFEPL